MKLNDLTTGAAIGRGSLMSFALVGAVGFAVDASILTALSVLLQLNIYMARCVSFSTATIVTWGLNRILTFRLTSVRNPNVLEYLKYVVVQCFGAAVNLLIFAGIVWRAPLLYDWPVVPLAIGAMGGMLINYLGSSFWVFRRGSPQ